MGVGHPFRRDAKAMTPQADQKQHTVVCGVVADLPRGMEVASSRWPCAVGSGRRRRVILGVAPSWLAERRQLCADDAIMVAPTAGEAGV